MRGVLVSSFTSSAPSRARRANHALVLLLVLLGGCSKPEPPRVLRVCADPNNLPFSDRSERGFENRIAEVLAEELGARLEYTWVAQRQGFFRAALGEGRCEVIIGVPVGLGRALTTRPYYRSSYVFVTSTDRTIDVAGVDDPLLEPDRFFSFDVAVGVRKGKVTLRDELQRALDRRHRDIALILERFGVPLLALPRQEASYTEPLP